MAYIGMQKLRSIFKYSTFWKEIIAVKGPSMSKIKNRSKVYNKLSLEIRKGLKAKAEYK